MASSDARLLLLHPGDNVLVARRPVLPGAVVIEGVAVHLRETLPLGHKLARRAIAPGEAVTKYGMPIGFATAAIAVGDSVHLHNVRSGYTASVSLEAADD